MRIYSHKGCQTCLVQATCSAVCDDYKNTLKRKYKIDVETDLDITLDQAESCVAQLMIDCGHAKINLQPGSKIRGHPSFGHYIETAAQIEK